MSFQHKKEKKSVGLESAPATSTLSSEEHSVHAAGSSLVDGVLEHLRTLFEKSSTRLSTEGTSTLARVFGDSTSD